MKLKEYASSVKVKDSGVTLPMGKGYALTVSLEGAKGKKQAKAGALVITALLALIGIY
jgi:hypothetical protein